MLFRAAYGVGGLLAPPICAGLFAWGEYFACFMFVGVGYLILAPFIYVRLYSAKEEWDKFPSIEYKGNGREPTTWELI